MNSLAISNEYIVLDGNKLEEEIEYIDFKHFKKFYKNSPAIRIDFKNNFNYSVKCIKKLIKLKNKGIEFFTPYQNQKIKYIILNYTDEIIDALKAIEITDRKMRFSFLYDNLCDNLDKIWKEKNPCNFCDDHCTNKKYIEPDGCCREAFDLKSVNKITFKKDVGPCKHLGQNGCTIRNLSCKFYACRHLRVTKNFEIYPKDFLLVSAFFSRKEYLVIRYNYFKTKEQIINKLLEKHSEPYFWFSYTAKFLIMDDE